MNKVISINLNSNAYQLDESGYIALKEYLEGAELQLNDNPDRAEIMADLEQAIADKCQKFLGANKTVVTAAEIQQIIQEMGPVDSAAGETGEDQAKRERKTSDRPNPDANPPKRLYLIREGSMLSGVCQGIGAYLHIDATIVRIVFVLLTIVTHGFFIIAYGILALLIPAANTPEERAEAQGKRFSAQDVIDDAKKTYQDFRNNKEWKKKWRQQKKEWKRKWRAETGLWSQNIRQSFGYSGRIVGTMMFPFFLLLNIAVPIVALLAIYALMNSGHFTAWRFPLQVPGFMELMLILVILGIVTSPLRAARRAAYFSGGSSAAALSAWTSVIWLGFVVVTAGFAYLTIPEVHYIVDNLPDILSGLVQ